MHNSILVFIFGVLFILLMDVAVFFQLKQYFRRRWQVVLYVAHSCVFIGFILLFQLLVSEVKSHEMYYWFGKLIAVIFLFYTPKLVFSIFNGIGLLAWFVGRRFSYALRFFAVVISCFTFLLLLYGITVGRYAYRVEQVSLSFEELPPSFEGFKVVHLSDLHLGSYGKSYRGIHKLVTMVNEQNPDLIVFTGDMVNNFSSEILLWKEELSLLKAKYGKYAVTGNHDYGLYTRWESEEEQQKNLRQTLAHIEDMGFKMLNNSNAPVVVNQDTIAIVGVENQGKPPFPEYGNLPQALQGVDNRFAILLSHDPSHWYREVLNYNIPLTLSGHTHAMQMGIAIGKYKWSPAKYIYREYDGLYEEENHRFLYVSRGQGYIGFPGRIGLRPEITVITLFPKK